MTVDAASVEALLGYLAASPSPYHAVANAAANAVDLPSGANGAHALPAPERKDA